MDQEPLRKGGWKESCTHQVATTGKARRLRRRRSLNALSE